MIKKRLLFLLIGILFLSVIQVTAKSNEEEGRITGKTTQTIQISIPLTVPLPTTTILRPIEVTYLTNISLPLQFLRNYTKNVWFNLDNGSNTTLFTSDYDYSSSATFYLNTTEGAHTVFLYANNNDGNITLRNAVFYVNLSRLTIIYDNFKSNGNSTNFYYYGFEELQNMSNVTFENTFYGKIFFTEPINITDHNSTNRGVIDFDSNVVISLNKISVNTTVLPNLKKAAKLSLRNLAFNNPRILRNGAVCPDNICIKESFNNSELIFNVTEFSNYSAEETPESVNVTAITPASSGGGGGGGGGEVKKGEEYKGDFNIDVESLAVKLKVGETKSKNVVITNNGTKKERISIHISFDNAKLSDNDFELDVGMSKNITIDFFIRENTLADLYVHKLQVSNQFGLSKILPVAIEVISKKSLFDVKLQIPEKMKVVNPGDEILAGVSIYNLGEIKRADANISYILKDSEGNILSIESEFAAVETQASLVKTIKIPDDAEPGFHFVYVVVEYQNEIGSATAIIKVVEKEGFIKGIRTILIWMVIILLALIVIFKLRNLIQFKKIYKNLILARRSRDDETPESTKKENINRIKDERRKLKQQLSEVGSMYKDKFIQEEEYNRVKNEIQRKIKEL